MNLFKRIFIEQCPICNHKLETNKSKFLHSVIIKSCPNGHYQKEFHPAFETYIESHKVS